MTPTDIAALMKGVAPALRDMVEATVSPLVARIADLEAQLAAVKVKDGQPGSDGAPGADGERGLPGADGKDGAAGRGVSKLLIDAKGHLVATFTDGTTDDVGPVVGKDGMDGRDGIDGAPGEKGIDGINGRDGTDGAPGAPGERGADGAVGKDGPAGRDGSHGTNGVDGKSVELETVVELVRSEVGKIAPDLVQKAVDAIPRPADGKDGAPGERGLQGERGEAGSPGPIGEKGESGAEGRSVSVDDVRPIVADLVERAVGAIPVPKDGKDGEPGKDGRDGAAGINGKDGLDGKDGPAGKLPLVKAWLDTVYREGEVVTHEGGTYQASRDTGKAPPHADWTCLAAPGRNGVDGRSFTVRGTYTDDEPGYRALDIVALNGGAFIARKDNPGPCPGEGWQVLAMRGKPGPAGEPGKRGEPGTRGLPGPGIAEMSIDGQGLLTVKNADGSTVDCDLYPVLVKVMG